MQHEYRRWIVCFGIERTYALWVVGAWTCPSEIWVICAMVVAADTASVKMVEERMLIGLK